MAFTQNEQKIIEWNKQNGKSVQEMREAILRYRDTGSPKDPRVVQPTPLERARGVGETAKGVGLGVVKGLGETVIGTAELLQTAGQGIIAAIDPTKTFAEIREQTGFKSLSDEGVKELLLAKSEAEKAGKVVAFAGELLVGGGATLLRKGFIKGSELATAGILRGKEILARGTEKVVEKIPEVPTTGILQKGKELVERIPRFFGRAKESTVEASQRAERIKISTPSVQQAIKSGLDERIINTVQQADAPTTKAFKEMVDIAESSTGKKGATLKVKQRPEIVAGRAAENEYKLIEKQRKNIGGQIGEIVDGLSKTTKVPMTRSYSVLDDILEQQGITIKFTKKGDILEFSGTRFTPAERLRIQELYKLAKEGGEELSPRAIRDKDQLFSKLQRETRLEGLGEIIVDTPEGSMSLFRVFRDVFTNELDNISPELRVLNREYRKFITLQDDIEKSIIKSGKFETTKGVDPAEFAQTNLRRLSSDALSAADYRAIVKEMDKVARELGYVGSNPEELALFANELRKIYPEVIPPTGFAGGIRVGAAELAERLLRAGKPDVTDQQKALREMLSELSKK